MSIVSNLNTITSSTLPKSKDDIILDKLKIKARHIIDKYIPDCALIAKGACQGPAEEYRSGFNYYTAPYLSKSDADTTLYMNVFDQVQDAGSTGLSSFELTGINECDLNNIDDKDKDNYVTAKNRRALFIKKIIFQSCLPCVEILKSANSKIYEGENFDEYMLWANAAIAMYNEITKRYEKNKEIDFSELENLYFGTFKPTNADGNRINKLASEITKAREAFLDVKAEMKMTNARSLVLQTINQTLKLFANSFKDGNSNAAWIKRILDTFNYILGKNTIFEALINCFLKVNEANSDAFDIGNDKEKASRLVKALYNIDEEHGKISVTPAVKQFKENKDFSIKHLLYYLFN